MKIKTQIVISIVIVAVIGTLIYLYCKSKASYETQKHLAKEVIRLHVIANSNSKEDQSVKLKVKESIVTYMRGILANVDNIEQAKKTMESHLEDINEIASEKLEKEGFHYKVSSSLENTYFPVKQYGDMTFPAGEYKALRVKLGNSNGRNWWCVMYPSLCFVDETYQRVPEDSKEKIKKNLTDEEYNSLLDGGDEIHYKSRIWEWLCNSVFA